MMQCRLNLPCNILAALKVSRHPKQIVTVASEHL
jgi:hypothetical protein